MTEAAKSTLPEFVSTSISALVDEAIRRLDNAVHVYVCVYVCVCVCVCVMHTT